METVTGRKQTSFRLREDLLKRLQLAARKENRSLNNFVESALMDLVNEPNEETKAAIEDAKGRSRNPDEVFDSVNDLMEYLTKE
ncbi:MAG: toxin-antitoxin system HicB family antitoxin [Tannerellaceae bacterium]|jgi:predicted transcriptional regulator|nr:toxin-antitoxin system HicB family antitoxin [Tannerellaceae bacterium]